MTEKGEGRMQQKREWVAESNKEINQVKKSSFLTFRVVYSWHLILPAQSLFLAGASPRFWHAQYKNAVDYQ